MDSKGLRVTTPTDTTIVMTRTFRSPRRLVWQAMTEPARMQRWMLPPPGWNASVCECEARVGGALRLAWESADGSQLMTLEGVFTEVEPHDRMVHTETMKIVDVKKGGEGIVIGELVETHEFAERDGVTLMRITQVYGSKEARDGAVASGMEEGMEACFARLEGGAEEG